MFIEKSDIGRIVINLDPKKDHIQITTSDGVLEIRSGHTTSVNRNKIIITAPKKIKIKRVGRGNNEV